MSDVVIRCENLSKQYRIGAKQEKYRTLRDSLANAAMAPFRTFTRNGSGAKGNGRDTIWALKDVSFEVKRGEVVGIIGRNGAGKSTLLKVLSRITEPTEGRAMLKGRISALLEVGTGFNLELTGRENIYLNAAILGMKKVEIDRKFDEIVAFAEVEKFIDTQVKHYSSGMHLRLGFAVAAHLEPEILVVDEVLAVGDAQFQKKCLGKMGDVARHGRTVLFVSHNMGAVTRLCGRSIWLDDGGVRKLGPTAEVVSAYLSNGLTDQAERQWAPDEAPGDDALRLLAVRVCQEGKPTGNLDITKAIEIEMETETSKPVPEIGLGLFIMASDGQVVLHTSDVMGSDSRRQGPGRRISVCRLPPYTLNVGKYLLSVGADVPFVRVVFAADNVLAWSVEATCPRMGRYSLGAWHGVVGPGLACWFQRRMVR